MCDSSALGIVILAAGSSSRMGAPKLLLPFKGSTLIQHALDVATSVGNQRVVVVTGAYRDESLPLIVGYDVDEVHNADWNEGQASSVRTGVEYLRANNCEAGLFMVADQPGIDTVCLTKMIETYQGDPHKAYVSRLGNKEGSPCVFPRMCFDELLCLTGDQGAKQAFRSWGADRVGYVDWFDTDFFDDIDTPQDYKTALEEAGSEEDREVGIYEGNDSQHRYLA